MRASRGEAAGVLGGTFDPVHRGHVHLALETRRLLGLSRTLLVPAANPPHKRGGDLSPIHHRVAMLQLAIDGLEGLAISPIELTRPGVGYTIDTLRLLREGVPSCQPVFILGMDSLAQIATWRHWRKLIEEFDLAVVPRAGDDGGGDERLPAEVAGRLTPVDERTSIERLHPGSGGRVFRLAVTPLALSSSGIRERARAGEDLSGLVPPGVARYIQRTGLYRQEENH